MSHKHAAPDGAQETARRTAPPFEARILQLVPGVRERRAIAQGEVDAILDKATGKAILLPDAQAALLALKRQFRSLLDLACDGTWVQDEHLRFTACSGTALGAASCDATLGRCWWELGFAGNDSIDWLGLRAQLAQRVAFHDFELCQRADDGSRRHLLVSGEPILADDGSFRGYRGITRDVSPQKLADGMSARSSVEPTTLDALVAPVCVLDADGRIVTSNAAWRAWAELPAAGMTPGSHYLDAWQAHDAWGPFDSEAVSAGLAQVARNERALFRFEHAFTTASGPRWLRVSASALRGAGGAQLMLVHDDVSAQKRSHQWLALEGRVAACRARAPDAATALHAVLAAVCEAQHWDCGQYFEHDVATATLGHVAQWSDARASEVTSFLAQSPMGRFRADAGLVGRVCQASQPLWLRDAHSDARVASALPHEIGLRGLFIFPVMADDKLCGVLVFGSRAELSDPDESCLRSVASIGGLLGHFLRRERELADLRSSEQRYRRYTALGCDWHFETDAELRFTASSAAGIAGVSDVLGKCLWELPHLRVSDEEWTRLKAELAAQWSFCDFACTALLPDGREARYFLSGEPVFDGSGVFSGFLGIGLDVTQSQR